MTTSNPTSNPTSAHRSNAPTAYSAEGTQPARVAPRRGSETKAAFKTTEFIAYVVAVIGVLVASFLVSTTDAHEDYFRADRAWFYIVLLSIGYMVSRGLRRPVVATTTTPKRCTDPQLLKTTQRHQGRGR